MAQGTIMPSPWFTGLDDNGRPLAGGRLYTYLAGTSTLLPTYSDAALTTPNTNPVILDGAGRATVYLGPYSYTFHLKDSTDAVVREATSIAAVAPFTVSTTIDGTAGENLAAGKAVFLSDGSGGRTAGRWYLADADDTAMSTVPVLVGLVETQVLVGQVGSIRIGGRATNLSGLTAGTSYYVSATAGALTSSAPANARLVGVADSTTSLVMADSTGQIPAARVAAGTFGTGNFVVTGNLSATGHLAAAGIVSMADGTVSAPGLAFTADLNTGFYRTGADGLGVTAGGVEQARWVGTQYLGGDGAVSGPAFSFLADSNTGIFRTGADGLGVTAGGVEQVRWVGTQSLHPNGTVAGPSMSFLSDVDTGIYRNASDDIRIAAGGADVAGFYNAGMQFFKAATFEAGITANALGSATTGTDLVISAGNAIRPKSSSRRYKENERPWTGDGRQLLQLEPKLFDYKGDGAKNVLFFIAEDVATVDPLYVNPNAEGLPESIRTDSLVAALVALAQQHERRLETLEAR